MWPADVHCELLNMYVICNHTQLQFVFAKNNFKNPASCRCSGDVKSMQSRSRW